ncbi:MAG: class I SAM-dependent methyltransferase [Chloroflexota bacterium]
MNRGLSLKNQPQRKAIMASQPIGAIHRLASAWDLWKLYRRRRFGSAEAEVRLHAEISALLSTYTGLAPGAPARILDLGCGQMARQVALFAADGARVTGVDVELPTYRLNPAILLRVLRHNGGERAIKSLARYIFFDPAYQRELRRRYPREAPYDQLDARLMSASQLDFPGDHFDLVYSVWAFEHFEDVPAAVREVDRTLKTTGVAVIYIHLYPSLSGGHHLDWLSPDTSPSRRVPPWDHLRQQRYPANFYLNRLRLQDYRRIFEGNLDVIDEQTIEEGHALLTPALWEELSARGYTREDLLTRSVRLICRKKPRNE